jgi:ubiquinone/menaquinone biosynthesis C-methylase UbiE
MTDFDVMAQTWDLDPVRVDRALKVAQAILEETGPLEGRRGLEFGCGTGLLGFALQPHLAHVTLADTSEGMLGRLREKIEAAGVRNMTPLAADLTTGPLPEERFDLVFTLMTLHHVPDTDALLARFRLLLAPGGVLCVSDLDTEDGSFHGAAEQVHHGFDRADFAARLARAGFKKIRMRTAFEMVREGEGGALRRYPAFLAVAERER